MHKYASSVIISWQVVGRRSLEEVAWQHFYILSVASIGLFVLFFYLHNNGIAESCILGPSTGARTQPLCMSATAKHTKAVLNTSSAQKDNNNVCSRVS